MMIRYLSVLVVVSVWAVDTRADERPLSPTDFALLGGKVERLNGEVQALKKKVTDLEAKLAAKTASAAVPATVAQYQQVCDPITGKCQLVPIPESGATAVGGSYPPFFAAGAGGCATSSSYSASFSSEESATVGSGRQPVLRIRGGPGLFRSIFRGRGAGGCGG